MTPELGIIEGFYGRPWTWAEREATAVYLSRHNYRFYHFAPKADLFLRRRWAEPHPAEDAAGLASLSRTCRAHGVRFGVGLSPYEIYRDFNEDVRAALSRKLAFLDEIGIDDLAILFDDMRGDFPDLAITPMIRFSIASSEHVLKIISKTWGAYLIPRSRFCGPVRKSVHVNFLQAI